MIVWTVRITDGSGGFAGAVTKHAGSIKSFVSAIASAPVVRKAANWAVDKAQDHGKIRDHGRKNYTALLKDLPRAMLADVRKAMPKSAKLTLRIEAVHDLNGRNISHYYNMANLSTGLTAAVDRLR